MSGFNSPAYFSKTFRELFDKTPKQFVEDMETKFDKSPRHEQPRNMKK